MKSFRSSVLVFLFSLSSVVCLDAASALANTRLGVGIFGGWLGGLSLQLDRGSVFSRSWSLGGELIGAVHGTALGDVRALYWEKPESMSGFFVGPKAWIAVGEVHGALVGGEGGWSYRFHNRLDLGASLDLLFWYAAWIGIKLNIGYLF